ncbi:allantoate permease [Pochonia chlamydosporia 170]|uniref:Allantoate permease n=1 Tax=Pochonia chlamydosporia 170 TaxID=1380566 RepID=A0A179FMA2_METCM|nr:allantoate permease [Pochonia chlamydosporia 170]OAQ66380.1 allantoate permease [Pochonia chlamydosporia 170]
MFRSLQARLFRLAGPVPANTSEYQPLHHDQDARIATANDEGISLPNGDGGPRLGSHRDAAAMMLIRLGRSPDEPISISPEDDARILRRIDIALLPLMLSVYFLQALDKATLSYASIFGLIDDTGLVGDQFSWLGSIVYLAQLVMQLPLALALVKLPIGKFTSVMVFAWGSTLVLMTWAHNFPQLMVARFFLGAFEASIGPSFVAITQMWWRRREQTMRIGSWYCMNGLTWVFGSLITYGLVSMHSSMKPYEIIFLFFGIVTVFVSGIMFYWMPDSPTEAKFLSDDDKVIAIERLRDNQMGVMSREWRFSHFYETLTDLKTWLWVVMMFCISVPSSGISTYGPQIMKSFLEDPYLTTLMNVPIGLSHVIAVSGSAYLSMKWTRKGPVIALLCIPPIIGLSILLKLPAVPEYRGALLTGYFCLSTFTGITPLLYSWSAQNTAGDTKRKSVSAVVFIGSSAGNVLGPLLFTPDDPQTGLGTIMGFFVTIIVLVILTTLYLKWLNRKHGQRRVALGKKARIRDFSLESAEEIQRLKHVDSTVQHAADLYDNSEPLRLESEVLNKAFADATDLENEDFMFVY